ncbi:MAG: ATP-binding protein [Sedimentisphaerales bacterium]
MEKQPFSNPFKPGAGHMPPYLAGRNEETSEFCKLLKQDVILKNLVLTGLRGVGKTVLLDTFKPLAVNARWLWCGADLSESASISDESLAQRLITDLSMITSGIVFDRQIIRAFGFKREELLVESTLDYHTLTALFRDIPGLVSDKLKGVLEFIWDCLKNQGYSGIIFAYDEAQNLADHSEKEQYPLSLLLDVFQSLQKKNIPFMLALVGLPTLYPKLVEARTFSERMFSVMFLDSLIERESRDAIVKPIETKGCPVKLSDESIKLIIDNSGGYPYFIQFICREVYDIFLQKHTKGEQMFVPVVEITRKLDNDFFAGRWAKVTDRQRELLTVIAELPNADEEFTLQEIAEKSKTSEKPFSTSLISQMLKPLIKSGLVYKNRHGKYSFAVPLLARYILRQMKEKPQQQRLF